jgi:hypothetical protein
MFSRTSAGMSLRLTVSLLSASIFNRSLLKYDGKREKLATKNEPVGNKLKGWRG